MRSFRARFSSLSAYRQAVRGGIKGGRGGEAYASRWLHHTRRRPRIATVIQRAPFYGRPGELKFHDLDIDDAVIATGATLAQDSCNKIPQGVTEVQRIGRKCRLKTINWRFSIELANTANMTDSKDVVRIILYLDKQANGATATTAQILESDDYQSFNNLANKSRFRTLMDRTYAMEATAGAGDGTTNDLAGNIIQDSFFKKINVPIEFDSTTGAITEIKSNNIGVMTLSKAGICTFLSKMRVRFSDN